MRVLNLAFLFTVFLNAVSAMDGAWYCFNCCQYIEGPDNLCDVDHPDKLFFDTFVTTFSTPMERSNTLYNPTESINQVTHQQPEDFAESSAKAISKNIPEKDFKLTLKRPSNSFFLYKQERVKLLKYSGMSMSQRVSQIAKEWHEETQEVRDKYTQEQNEVSSNFKLQNPDYKFSPKRSPQVSEVKGSKKRKGKGRANEKTEIKKV